MAIIQQHVSKRTTATHAGRWHLAQSAVGPASEGADPIAHKPGECHTDGISAITDHCGAHRAPPTGKTRALVSDWCHRDHWLSVADEKLKPHPHPTPLRWGRAIN